MYGRDCAGHSSTSATNQPADTIIEPSAAKSWSSRVRSGVGPATR